MDKTRYKILFSLEPSNRNTAARSLPAQQERERERERERGEKIGSKKGIGRSRGPRTVRSFVTRMVSVSARWPTLLRRGAFSPDCTYLHGIPNGDSPWRVVARSRWLTLVNQTGEKMLTLADAPVNSADQRCSSHGARSSESDTLYSVAVSLADCLLLLLLLRRLTLKFERH